MNEAMRIFVKELLDFASQAVVSSGNMDAEDVVRLHRKLAGQSMYFLGMEADHLEEGEERDWVLQQRENLASYWQDSRARRDISSSPEQS